MADSSPIDTYLATLPADQRAALQRLRCEVPRLVPDAVETISYGLPTFKLHGRGLLSFAGWKAHCSIYPLTGSFLDAHAEELKGYRRTKGSLHFTPEEPLPAHGELIATLGGRREPLIAEVAQRRAEWEVHGRLVPPLVIGRMPMMLRVFFDRTARTFGASFSDRALVRGVPASPGRATGAVRIVRSPADFDQLRDGEILVAPLTAPAWTPLFARASGVVTDVGSAMAHASIIAREYGIPAVVGCGDATARLTDGMRVTVDGGTGTVELASSDGDPRLPVARTD